MDFLDEKIVQYAEQHTDNEPSILQEINRETYAKVLMPRMLAGHLQGRILAMFSKMVRPKNILEIGTYTGYSAICLAEGLQEGGMLHTIDINEELEEMVKRYFNKAGLAEQLHLHIGNALEIIPMLSGPFDLVFVDADKVNYANYFDLAIEKMSRGGILVADNVLWSGKVLENSPKNDEDTQALIEFNRKIQEDERVENVLFPIRDGLMVIRKR